MFIQDELLKKVLMRLISLTSITIFIILFRDLWKSPEMVFPEQAFFQLWLPNLPFFLFFATTIYIGIFLYYASLKFLIGFTPILFIFGLFAFFEFQYTTLSHITIFFKANLYGFLQILLALLIIIAWRYNVRIFKPHH